MPLTSKRPKDQAMGIALAWLLNEYTQVCNDAGLQPSTRDTYVLHAQNFVRWCQGEFVPGARVAEREGRA